MQSLELYRMLTTPIRRGLFIFPILWVVSLVLSIFALITAAGRPWAVTAFLAVVIFYWAWIHVRKRNASAQRVGENPELVYWVHPTNGPQFYSRPISDDAIDYRLLHLRDGTDLEVGLPMLQMRVFISRLHERNPSMRQGPYDNIESTTISGCPVDRETFEVRRMIIDHKIARSLIISNILQYASFVVLFFSLVAGPPSTVPAFLVAVIFYIRAMEVRKSYNQAFKVAANPQLVYWGHPTSQQQSFSEQFSVDCINECILLLLHLRDGTKFEVDLPTEQMRNFIAWLDGKNPSMRWGEYDNIQGAGPSLTGRSCEKPDLFGGRISQENDLSRKGVGS